MEQVDTSIVKPLRIVAWAEGISFLLILFVSMPLKYIWEKPELNQFTGYIHGVLFIVYVIVVWLAGDRLAWKGKTKALALAASIIPFGTFWADHSIFNKYK
ncbi:MAG: DUF3817 domain-containing protein [Saprospiraceae bacterium]|nr:DUF3817 domain-containing protein [Saprospiraceae bacterium]